MVLKSIFSLSSCLQTDCMGLLPSCTYSLVAPPPPHPPPTARMIQAKWVVEIFPTRRFPHRFPRNHSLWFPTHGWWKSSPADSNETQIFLWFPTHGWWKSSPADSEETHFLWFPTWMDLTVMFIESYRSNQEQKNDQENCPVFRNRTGMDDHKKRAKVSWICNTWTILEIGR